MLNFFDSPSYERIAMDDFAERQIEAICEKVGDGRVLCALSGGVDSSAAAVLLSRAVGKI